MNNTEAFAYLFSDSFWSAFVFSVQSDLVFLVMKLWGGYPMWLAVLIASVATIPAMVANMWIGRLVNIAFSFSYEPPQEGNKHTLLDKVIMGLLQYGYLVALFTWIPLVGGVASLFLGFLRYPFALALPACLIGNLVFYLIFAYI